MSLRQHPAERLNTVESALPVPTRRRLILAGVAGTAVMAGVAVAWQKLATRASSAGLSDPFWQMGFDTPEGRRIETSAFHGRPLLVNFWAPWCPPCIEELPMLEAFYRAGAAQGWQVLGLAVDKPDAVQRFLTRMPLSFPIALAGLQATGLSRSLGNEAGGLPFSVVFGVDGKIAQRRTGRLSADELRSWTGVES